MTLCDFEIAVRLIAPDGVTVLFDFNNLAGRSGWAVVSRQEPGDATSKTRVGADGVDGDYDVEEHDTAGDYVLLARVYGNDWPDLTANFLAARTAYRAHSQYYLEQTVQGVTTRYRTGRPDSVQPGEPDLMNNMLTYSIRWHVQPNPTITFV